MWKNKYIHIWQEKLEQLERLHSENSPTYPIIAHTIDSYQIPCQNKQDQSYTLKKIHKFNL